MQFSYMYTRPQERHKNPITTDSLANLNLQPIVLKRHTLPFLFYRFIGKKVRFFGVNSPSLVLFHFIEKSLHDLLS